MKNINIAIDGPSGAGKSSLAKNVAKRLGYVYVDTGALYRSIGYHMLRSGIDPKNSENVKNALSGMKISFSHIDGTQHVFVNGDDVSDKIRTQEVSMAASAVSAIPEVRAFLLDCQRNIAENNSVVMDGRDVGTVILPNADVKIFLTASAEDRATRRHEEMLAVGLESDYEETLRLIKERDLNDSSRETAPLKKATDAAELDNSGFMPEETLSAALKIISDKIGE